MTRCRYVSTPTIRSISASPNGLSLARAKAVGIDLLEELNRLASRAIAARFGAGGAGGLVRAGVPHAAVGARGRRFPAGERRDESPVRPRTCRTAASSACRCWRRGGWSSGASGSSRCSTAAAAPAPGTPTPVSGPTIERNALAVDQPIGGLLQDLSQRGLLDETLVVFATEFGRTPGSQGSDGRDHHIFGFSVWLAGGGIKGGVVHGATDEIGFHAVENRHYVTDIHATILKQLGLDSRRLEIPGRKRLDIDHGKPIDAIIA